MIVSETVGKHKRNRGNPALLSSNGILAAITASLFSSFSSLVLSTITITRIAYARRIDTSANDFSLLLYGKDEDDNNKQFSSPYSSTLWVLRRTTRQQGEKKTICYFPSAKDLEIHNSIEIC
jgi:hypothetical protein